MKAYQYLQKNFSKIVNKYGGQYVVIAGNKVFSGKDAKELEKEAKETFPKEEALGTPIPKPQDFASVL